MKANQLRAGVVLSYLSIAVGILISVIYTPAMLRLLGQNEYGIYSLASSVTSYLSLFSLGFSNAYIRYFMRFAVKSDNRGIARLNGMFVSIFTVLGVLALVCGMILACKADVLFAETMSAEEIHRVRIIMAVMTANMAVSLPMSVFTSYISVCEKYIFLKAAGIIRSVISPLLTLPVLIIGGGSIGMAVISASLSVLTDSVYGIYCIKKLDMEFSFGRFDTGLLKEIWIFSSFIFLNMITDQINWNTDKFLLGTIKSTAATAIYAVASQLNTYYLQFSQAISSVFIPRVNRIIAESDDNNQLTDLFTRVGRAQFMVLALILSGFVIFGYDFIMLWAGEGYEQSYLVALFLLVPVTIPSVQNLGLNIQQAKNKHKFRSVVYFAIAICNVAVSIPLCGRYGAVGAAAGTAFALFVGNGIAMNIYYHRAIGLDILYFWKKIVSIIPAVAVTCLFGAGLHRLMMPMGWRSLFVCGMLYCMVYGACIWCFGMNKDEKTTIISLLKR